MPICFVYLIDSELSLDFHFHRSNILMQNYNIMHKYAWTNACGEKEMINLMSHVILICARLFVFHCWIFSGFYQGWNTWVDSIKMSKKWKNAL